jgi:hypothetical protein
MTPHAADDFTFIAARIREIKHAPIPADLTWWCDDCQRLIAEREVTPQALHDESRGGCGCEVSLSCQVCRNTGWIDESLGGEATSGWSICPDCRNPNKLDQP